MNQLTNQFNNQGMQVQENQQYGMAVGASREMEEVKGQIFMAKQFPRNVFQAEQRIVDSCARPSLAATAVYSFPRGGTKVTGASIRLAEMIAQNWGNLTYGFEEISQQDGQSLVKAYCWDLETNVRHEKKFTVSHTIGLKGGKTKILTDARDIYEKVANEAQRRVRACILSVIPGDITEKAVQQCNQTLAGNSQGPLKDRVAKALAAFKDNYRVTQEQVEAKFGYNAQSFTEHDYVDLIQIFNSIKDGVAKVEDFFPKDTLVSEQKSTLTEQFKAGEK